MQPCTRPIPSPNIVSGDSKIYQEPSPYSLNTRSGVTHASLPIAFLDPRALAVAFLMTIAVAAGLEMTSRSR